MSAGVDSVEALDKLDDIRTGMFRVTAGYQGMLFTLDEQQIGVGPCTEIYTMEEILNTKEARRDLAAHGHATVTMRVTKRFPPVRYLGPCATTAPKGDRRDGRAGSGPPSVLCLEKEHCPVRGAQSLAHTVGTRRSSHRKRPLPLAQLSPYSPTGGRICGTPAASCRGRWKRVTYRTPAVRSRQYCPAGT
ncbi:hypothetical protein [Streptomyces sp. NBC_00334]|uniref:hypothetical protein n=1 Tax=Streptomyces sp. NBC_00334 TaxID=2975713 RepID=UPI002E2A665F|nr:hypothetical protein [Streptomyces sp. NBC_00334]